MITSVTSGKGPEPLMVRDNGGDRHDHDASNDTDGGDNGDKDDNGDEEDEAKISRTL